jgi:hypothetical protein
MKGVHTKQGRKACMRRQHHAKRRPLAPATGRHRAASVLSAALLSLVGIGAIPVAAATCASLASLVIRDDQPDAREGQAGRTGVAERSVVPLKPGNAGVQDRRNKRRGAGRLGNLTTPKRVHAEVQALQGTQNPRRSFSATTCTGQDEPLRSLADRHDRHVCLMGAV